MGTVLSEAYADIYQSYTDHVQSQITKNSYEKKKSSIMQLLKWFESEDLLPEEISISDVIRYKQYLSETTSRSGTVYASGSICNFLKAGRNLWDYLIQDEKVKSNPFREVPYPRVPYHLSRNFLNESQMNRLLESLTHFENLEEYRAHVVCEFLYASGLRIAEASNLLPSDVDTSQRLVYVRNGKGGESRTAFLTTYAAEVMELYLKKGRNVLLGRCWRKNDDKLFGCDKRTLSGAVCEEISKVCKRLELPEMSCHGFRHSLGTHLLRSGCDMRHIQVILGHESLNSTQVYTRVDKDDLRESIDSYHPRKYRKEKEGNV
jgi:integrase/recombinase XerD